MPVVDFLPVFCFVLVVVGSCVFVGFLFWLVSSWACRPVSCRGGSVVFFVPGCPCGFSSFVLSCRIACSIDFFSMLARDALS